MQQTCGGGGRFGGATSISNARCCGNVDGGFGGGRSSRFRSAGRGRRYGSGFTANTSGENGLLVIGDGHLSIAVRTDRNTGGAVVDDVAIRSSG